VTFPAETLSSLDTLHIIAPNLCKISLTGYNMTPVAPEAAPNVDYLPHLTALDLNVMPLADSGREVAQDECEYILDQCVAFLEKHRHIKTVVLPDKLIHHYQSAYWLLEWLPKIQGKIANADILNTVLSAIIKSNRIATELALVQSHLPRTVPSFGSNFRRFPTSMLQPFSYRLPKMTVSFGIIFVNSGIPLPPCTHSLRTVGQPFCATPHARNSSII
jgi:hypothetical protein